MDRLAGPCMADLTGIMLPVGLLEEERHVTWVGEIKAATVWLCDGKVEVKSQVQAFLATQLALHLRVPVAHVHIDWSTGQAPRLLCPFACDPPVSLGISRCGRQVALAIAPVVALGIDLVAVEPVPDWEAVAALYFGPHLTQSLAVLATPAQAMAFAHHWALLEAQLKCLGCGLLEWSVGRDEWLRQVGLQVAVQRLLPTPKHPNWRMLAVATNVGAH